MSDIKVWFADNKEFISKYLVIIIVALCQGATGLSDLSISYLYKDDFNMSPNEVAAITGITFLPWIFKPFYGIMTDCVPICGQRRKSYLLIFSFLAFIGWYLIAFQIASKNVFIVLFTSIQLCISFCNVVGEALLVEISKQRGKKFNMTKDEQQAEAGQNVSLFFGIRNFGVLITAFLGGYLLNFMDKHYIFAITGVFPLLLFIASTFIPSEQEEVNENQGLEKLDQFSTFFTFMKKPFIYQPLIFVLLFAMTPSCSTAMFYFYTNVLMFDPTFFGTLKFLSAVASFLGVVIYNSFLKNSNFKSQFISSTLLGALFSASTLLLIFRVNGQLGIPDKFFTIGDSVVIQAIGEINMMPILVLAVHLCPPKIEATMYSVIMSTSNLGTSISYQLGGVLMSAYGVTENNFDNLWLVSLISTISSLVPLLLINLVDQKHLKSAKKCFSNLEEAKGLPENKDAEDTALVQGVSEGEEKVCYDSFKTPEVAESTGMHQI